MKNNFSVKLASLDMVCQNRRSIFMQIHRCTKTYDVSHDPHLGHNFFPAFDRSPGSPQTIYEVKKYTVGKVNKFPSICSYVILGLCLPKHGRARPFPDVLHARKPMARRYNEPYLNA